VLGAIKWRCSLATMGICLSRRDCFKRTVSLLASLRLGAGVKDRITSLRVWPVSLSEQRMPKIPKFTSDFDSARWHWRGPFAQLTGAIIVEIRTEQGLTGYGMGGGGGAGAYIVDHHLRDFLIGADPLQIELLNDQMYSSTSFYGRKGVPVMAISGIDLALWDVLGKNTGKPVWQLLGGKTKDKVAAYYTGFDVEQALKMGFKAVKIPMTEGVAQGLEGMKRTVAKLTLVREMIGPDAELMIDCNSLWDVPYALEMADRLASLRINWFEEPLNPDDVAGYETLCSRVHRPRIAHGEHEYTHNGFEDLIRRNAIHLLQPDLTWSGGLTESRRIATLAAVHDLPIVPHRGGSPYGMALITASPNCHLAESFGTGEAGNDLMAALTSRFEKGYYYPADGAGFGVNLNESLIRKYAHD
jgi:L-rhamnonate dehydratase